jgi:hypothetical protein
VKEKSFQGSRQDNSLSELGVRKIIQGEGYGTGPFWDKKGRLGGRRKLKDYGF